MTVSLKPNLGTQQILIHKTITYFLSSCELVTNTILFFFYL